MNQLQEYMTGSKAYNILDSNKYKKEEFAYEMFRIIDALQTHIGMISKMLSPLGHRDKNNNLRSHLRAEKLIEILDLINLFELSSVDEIKDITSL